MSSETGAAAKLMINNSE